MTLQGSANVSDASGAGDETLLRVFVEEKSGEAFEALVRRHVSGVYAHARRRLGDAGRAEDVTQAVFFLLARKAHTLKGAGPLVGWLYRVTRYVCANARKIDGRRRRHEQEAARMKSEAISVAGSVPEVEVHLDRVLGELPARERDAVLLRYVQGYSVGEVAAMTHSTEAAARKRLHRGLERMRARFAALGVAVPAESAAWTALAGMGVPGHVVTASFGVGLSPTAVAPAVVHLAHGGWTMLFLAQAKVVVLAAGIVVLATAGAGAVLLEKRSAAPLPAVVVVAAAPAPATAVVEAVPTPVLAEPVEKAADPIVVHGTVFDPAGKPLAGAKVTVPCYAGFLDHGVHPVAQAVSGADGRYAVSFRKADASAFSDGAGSPAGDAWKTADVVASAQGLGMAWAEWDHADVKGNVDLKLSVDDVPIEGRVLGADGKPAEGTMVIVQDVDSYMPAVFEAAYAKGPAAMESLPEGLEYPLGARGEHDAVVTDAEGRFRITGLGKGHWVRMKLYGPHAGLTQIEAVTEAMEPFDRGYKVTGAKAVPTVRVFGAKFDFTATPEISIEGVVRDAKTHAAIPGVIVIGDGYANGMSVSTETLKTVSGTDGHYRIDGFPVDGKSTLLAVSRGAEPYLAREYPIAAMAGGGKLGVDIELNKGVWVAGRVTDKATGKGVMAQVQYSPYVENPNSLALPEFKQYPHGGGVMDGPQWQYETKPDGSYRVAAIVGKGVLGVQYWGHAFHYRTGAGGEGISAYADGKENTTLYQSYPMVEFANGLAEVNPGEKGLSDVNFQLDAGETVHAVIVDGDGKPVPGCVVQHSTMAGNGDGTRLTTAAFDITGLSPGENRVLVVGNLERKLGIVLPFTASDAKGRMLTIHLEPTAEISGKCVDPSGKPAGNVIIDVDSRESMGVGGTTTDADGEFHCPVIAGATVYSADVAAGPYYMSRIARQFSIEAGETRDLGTVKLKASKAKY